MLSWEDIIQTDEYAADKEILLNVIEKSLANEAFNDDDKIYIDTIAHLAAVHRYFVRHLAEQKDIDKTQFLNLIQAEVGVEIPYTNAIPVIQFLKENKNWYGHKGTKVLYDFIGEIIGSPIEVHFPWEQIAVYSDGRSYYSGDAGSFLPWDESKLAYYEDGIFWSYYTYIVTVTQAHNAGNLIDFGNLIKSIHPAGTKRFIEFQYKYLSEAIRSTISHTSRRYKKAYFIKTSFPALSMDLIASGGYRYSYSMRGGHEIVSQTSVIYAPEYRVAAGYKQIWMESMLHEVIDGHEHWVFSRLKPLTDGEYDRVYADNDQFVYDSQTLNMGFKDMPLSAWGDRPLREIQHIAWDNDGKHMNTGFFPYMAHSQITEL